MKEKQERVNSSTP